MTIQHGWQTCRACHQRGQDIRVEGDWHLRANPGYWGASAPEVLVLGFSKGATQIAAAKAGDFDGVAFAKMRPRLRQVLDALGVDLKGQTIDEALSANGQQLGAASLIRCGLSVMENGKLVTSGTIMPKAARAPFPRHVMLTCIAQHLNPLPASVTRVLLLGTTNAYIQGVKALMREQFPDYRDINEVAFQAQGRTWVFAAHPSPANGEFKKWLNGDATDTSGLKRILAQRALSVAPRPSLSITTAEPRPAISSASIPVYPVKSPAMSHSAPTDDLFAQTFHLVRYDGRKIVPVKMKNQDTGRVAFRVVKLGNHKKDSLEVTDETELLRYCESGQYQVRACPLDRSTPANFIRPLLNHRIMKIPAG